MTPAPELLTNNQAARYLGIVPGTLNVWRCTSRYHIPFLRIGNRVRYRPEDLNAFLTAHMVNPADKRPEPEKRKRQRRKASAGAGHE